MLYDCPDFMPGFWKDGSIDRRSPIENGLFRVAPSGIKKAFCHTCPFGGAANKYSFELHRLAFVPDGFKNLKKILSVEVGLDRHPQASGSVPPGFYPP